MQKRTEELLQEIATLHLNMDLNGLMYQEVMPQDVRSALYEAYLMGCSDGAE